ncbi:hypothetical protein E1287_00860 [Actinomadura sp. KC06]|uniref:hypothetical protein n=1 Tax=Actinomadura sp. KC06 TaxID=2530369 RepID=UPI0010488DD7|nr:hypothetical protein [Actinomadura sp. KC06]TDD40555.1 hypothetical protein E1287_00860 [Actinomadura sp. KC06]
MYQPRYSTFDPLIEHKPVSMLRLLSPLRAPAPGTALVLVPREGAPITVRHGEPVPAAHYGVHQYSCLVTLAEHALAFEIALVSRDPGFVFRSRVIVHVHVGEPALVVSRGIRDVGATLYEPIKHMLRPVARNFDIAEFHQADEALNTVLGDFHGDSALRLRNATVELLPDEDEVANSARSYREVTRETRLGAMRRDRHLDMMRREGTEGMLAEIFEREGPSKVLDWIAHAEATERAELLRLFQQMMNRAGVDREPFDHLEAERQVVDRLTGGSSVAFGGTRRVSRVRGSLPPRPPETPRTGPVDAAKAPASPQSRYPAGPSQPPGPPEDEPLEPPREDAGPPRSRVRGARPTE